MSAVRHHRGFTLIELMVVVGIIIILVGLTVGTGVILHEKSEQRQVENAFKILDSALAEWELSAERQLTWGKDGLNADGTANANAYYDLQSNQSGALQMTALLSRLMSVTSCKEMLSKIDPAMLIKDPTDQTKWKLVDPWGTAIVMLHPGRKWIQGDPGVADPDGTIRTTATTPNGSGYYNENNFGVCVNRRICFISAGPNTKFGKLSVVPGSSDYVEQHDNIYSYKLTNP